MKNKLKLICLLALWSSFCRAQNITAVEYFIDTDPGVGLANSLAIGMSADTININTSISLTGYAVGFHNIYIRAKNILGVWNVIEQRPFYISNPALNTYSANTNIEYFIDTDPGVGLGTDLPIADGDTLNAITSIPLTGIPAGFHNLYVRTKTSAGLWNVIEQRPFYISSPALNTFSANTNIEYFIDTDPGVGLATDLPIADGDTLIAIASIPLTGIPAGLHNLYVRTKTSAGLWNVIEQRPFYISDPSLSNVTEITKIEYFFDSDPGVGLATNLPILTPPNDSVTINSNIVVPCLSNGMHFLWIRAKNNLGVWNVVEYDTLNVGGSMYTQPIVSAGPDTVCFPATVNMNADSAAGITYQWLDNGNPISGATFANYVATVSGKYSLRQTCNAGIVTSNAIDAVVNYVPDITFCPSVAPLNNDGGLCSAIVTYASATAIGSVPLPVITYSQNSGTAFNVGTTTVNVVATNMCGVDNCSFNVVVYDNENPLISCPGGITINCQDSQLPAHTGSATATDNCDLNPSISYSDVIVGGNCPGNYSINRTWQAIDIYNNSSSCIQVITVQDITAPIIICPNNITINCEDSQLPINTGIATANDNCDANSVITYTDGIVVGNCPGNYIINRIWKAIDNCNNILTCTQVITVQDTTAPVITCPNNITINCEDSQLPINTGSATAMDICDANPVISFDDEVVDGNCPGNYIINRKWTATDNCNNSSTCTQVITVQDITSPVIVCPNDTLVEANIPECRAKISLNTPTVLDVCGPTVISNNAPATFPTGTTLVTWTATDECNNSASCTQNVTVTSCILLNLKIFIEGFYVGNGLMQPVLFNSGESNDASVCDSVIVELHNQTAPYGLIGNPQKVLINVNGKVTLHYPESYTGSSYYIVVRHRNTIETWSKFPVLLSTVSDFDFTN